MATKAKAQGPPSGMTDFPRMTVGVMGSAGGRIPEGASAKMRRLGAEIARRGYVLLTGACPGIPHQAVLGAKSEGGLVVGVSPALNFREHVAHYRSPSRGYDAIIYTGNGLMGREIETIRSCDVVIFAGGRSGTLGEFAIAFDEGKVLGVLTGTGGITEHLGAIVKLLEKDTGAVVCSNSDPVALLDELEQVYRERVLPQHRAALEGRDPDGELEE